MSRAQVGQRCHSMRQGFFPGISTKKPLCQSVSGTIRLLISIVFMITFLFHITLLHRVFFLVGVYKEKYVPFVPLPRETIGIPTKSLGQSRGQPCPLHPTPSVFWSCAPGWETAGRREGTSKASRTRSESLSGAESTWVALQGCKGFYGPYRGLNEHASHTPQVGKQEKGPVRRSEHSPGQERYAGSSEGLRRP